MKKVKKNSKSEALLLIKELFKEAEIEYKNDISLANEYIKLAWKIKKRHNVRLTPELKRLFCRKCLSYWVPGKTVRIRTRKGLQIFYCLNCKRIKRFSFK